MNTEGKKRILVACGTGGVTSKNIAMRIEKYLKEQNIPCTVGTCKVIEVRSMAESLHPDLFVSATQLPDTGIPTVKATAILTGVGVDKVYKEILEKLK